MPRTLFFLLLITAGTASAQTRCFRILSARNGVPVSDAAVSGIHSEAVWISDSLGIVRVDAADAGPFRISHLSYQTRILRPDSAAADWIISLQPQPYALSGVEVFSPLARFRRDSALNHGFFRRELADAHFTPGMKLVFIRARRSVEAALEWQGVFTNFAIIASGKMAQYKRFSRELGRIEARKFAAIRYTTALVVEQTGLEEEPAMAFIAAHPLDEDYLRNASELELKMRIRDMYRSKR